MKRTLLLLLGVVACEKAPPSLEAISLLGDSLFAPAGTLPRNDSLLGVAEVAYAHAPDNVDSIIWFGRRTAYQGQYREALGIYTVGLDTHPDDARLLRHRGHRWITVRQLGQAVDDLSRAAELIEGQPDRIEEDGMPNAAGIPVSTLHTNIWYHLGLAQYLRGALPQARAAWTRGLAASTNADMTVAFQYWLVLTEAKLGDSTGVAARLAAVDPDVELLENTTYQRLLLHFRGDLPADALVPSDSLASVENVTAAYGVAAWQLISGNVAHAVPALHRIIAARDFWAAFGYVAAESELARLGLIDH